MKNQNYQNTFSQYGILDIRYQKIVDDLIDQILNSKTISKHNDWKIIKAIRLDNWLYTSKSDIRLKKIFLKLFEDDNIILKNYTDKTIENLFQEDFEKVLPRIINKEWNFDYANIKEDFNEVCSILNIDKNSPNFKLLENRIESCKDYSNEELLNEMNNFIIITYKEQNILKLTEILNPWAEVFFDPNALVIKIDDKIIKKFRNEKSMSFKFFKKLYNNPWKEFIQSDFDEEINRYVWMDITFSKLISECNFSKEASKRFFPIKTWWKIKFIKKYEKSV